MSSDGEVASEIRQEGLSAARAIPASSVPANASKRVAFLLVIGLHPAICIAPGRLGCQDLHNFTHAKIVSTQPVAVSARPYARKQLQERCSDACTS